MTTQQFSWNLLDDQPSATDPHDQIPHGLVIRRFALSFILVPFQGYPRPSLTVVNIHPDTWNSWMFPYGGLRLSDSSAAKDATTFSDLSASLHRLVVEHGDEYLRAANEELSSFYPEEMELNFAAPFYRNYSLKFSKTSDQWTAYIFTYHAFPASRLAVGDLPQNNIALNPENVDRLLRDQTMAGTPIEENVLALLQSRIARMWALTSSFLADLPPFP